jgi:hypothetical protein
MKNISKRGIKLFLLGMLAMLLIELVYDWKDAVQGFKDGYSSVRNQ